MVTPTSLKRRKIRITSSDRSGSRLPVGSSAISNLGRVTMARAIPTRCCSPADKVSGFWFSLCNKPTWSRAARTRRPASRCPTPAMTSGSATLSETGRSSSSLWSWKTMPIWRLYAGILRRFTRRVFCPSTITWPLVGRSISAIRRKSVLLPAPEWPVTNNMSPLSTARLSPDNASWPPGNRLVTSSSWIIMTAHRQAMHRQTQWPKTVACPLLTHRCR